SVEGIADGLEDGAAVGFNRGADQIVVAGQGVAHRLRELLPEPGAALDVGEQEGARRRGQGDAPGCQWLCHRVPPGVRPAARLLSPGGRSPSAAWGVESIIARF